MISRTTVVIGSLPSSISRSRRPIPRMVASTSDQSSSGGVAAVDIAASARPASTLVLAGLSSPGVAARANSVQISVSAWLPVMFQNQPSASTSARTLCR